MQGLHKPKRGRSERTRDMHEGKYTASDHLGKRARLVDRQMQRRDQMDWRSFVLVQTGGRAGLAKTWASPSIVPFSALLSIRKNRKLQNACHGVESERRHVSEGGAPCTLTNCDQATTRFPTK